MQTYSPGFPGESTIVKNAGEAQLFGNILYDAMNSEEIIQIAGKEVKLSELYSYARNGNLFRQQGAELNPMMKAISDALAELTGSDSSTINSFTPENLAKIGTFNLEENQAEMTGKLITIPKILRAEGAQDIQEILNKSGQLSGVTAEIIDDLMSMHAMKDPTEILDLIEQRQKGLFGEEAAAAYRTKLSLLKARFDIAQDLMSPRNQEVFGAIGLETTHVGIDGVRVTSPATTEARQGLPSVQEFMKRIFSSEADYDASILDDMAASLGDITTETGGKGYTRIGDMIGELFKTGKPMTERGSLGPAVQALMNNKGKVIGAAAIATGLAVFGHIKAKHRSEDTAGGPPLLPGGSAYEGMMPDTPVYPDINSGIQQPGTSYNISISGDDEQSQEFIKSAGLVTNGQVNGTMYNNTPRLGRNSYDDIAGSF